MKDNLKGPLIGMMQAERNIILHQKISKLGVCVTRGVTPRIRFFPPNLRFKTVQNEHFDFFILAHFPSYMGI